MLRDEDRGARRGAARQELHDRPRARRVKLRRRLVEDEESRPHAEDRGDGHALLLAAGQRCRQPVGKLGDPECLEGLIDPGIHLEARDAEVLEAEGELLADAQLGARQLVRGRREDDPHPAQQVADRRLGHRPAGDGDASAQLRPDDAGDEGGRGEGEGGLASAVPAGHPDDLAGSHGEIDPGEGRRTAAVIADRQRLEGQRRSRGRDVPPGRRRRRHQVAAHRIPSAGATKGHRTTTAIARMVAARIQRSPGGSATTR